jgi:hypothetical protein
MMTTLETVVVETTAIQNRNGWVAIGRLFLVGSGTAKEDRIPLRSLYEHESAACTQPDSLAHRNRILVIARHPDSLQSIGHV